MADQFIRIGNLPSTPLGAISLTSSVGGSQPFYFGQTFPKGLVPNGVSVITDTSGVTMHARPLRRWNDGSLKHMQFCGQASFTPGVPKVVDLKTGTAAGGSNLTSASIVTANPQASLQCGAIGTVNLQDLLATPFRTWTSTPSMVECAYRAQVGADTDLIAWFYVKLFSSGKLEVRVAAENGFLTTNPGTKTYTATVVIGGVTVHNTSVTHYAHKRWNVVAWIGGDPGFSYAHTVQDLIDTKMVPNYWKRSPANATLNALQQIYTPNQLSPHPTAGATGGFSEHIGPFPLWDALHVATADSRSYKAVLVAASSLMTYSLCWRISGSGRVPKPTDAPTQTISGGGAGTFSLSNGAGTIEFNHLQNSGYLAYLITGDNFHYEQMALLTSAVYFSLSTSNGSGTNKIYLLETRGSAECLRQLGSYCAIAPMESMDSADLAVVTDYRALFASQAAWWKGRTEIPGMNLLGTLWQFSIGAWDAVGSVAPWMMGYQVITFGMISDMEPIDNMADWNAARDWQYKWPVGLAGGAGTGNFCFTRAGQRYGISITNTDATTDATTFFDSWSDVWLQTFGSANNSCPIGSALVGTPGDSDDPARAAVNHRWGVFLGALAYAKDHGAPGANDAWTRFTGASNWSSIENGSAAPANFNDTPIWGLTSRNLEPAWLLQAIQTPGQWLKIASGSGKTVGDVQQLPRPNVPPISGSIVSVCDAWNGMAVDQIRKELLAIASGGHANNASNECYALDMLKDDPGWRRILDRTPDAQMTNPSSENGGLYADGRARSMHNCNSTWADGRVWFPMMNSVASGGGGAVDKVCSFDRDSLGNALTPQAWANNPGPWAFHGPHGANSNCYHFGYGAWDPLLHRMYGIGNNACTGICIWSFSTLPGDPQLGVSDGFFTSGTHIRPCWAACLYNAGGKVLIGDRENGGRIVLYDPVTEGFSVPARSGTFHYSEGSGAIYLPKTKQIVVSNPKETNSDLFVIDLALTSGNYAGGTLTGRQLAKSGGPDYNNQNFASTNSNNFGYSKFNVIEDIFGYTVVVFFPSVFHGIHVMVVPTAGF